jgi:HEPN domain-containing protein
MKLPDVEILQKVRQWLEFGDEDLRLARHGLTLKTSVPYRLIAFHGQQCVEKMLKAFLVFHEIDFPYTHNISHLLELCAKHADWASAVSEAEELTPFAITARYPGEDEKVSRKECLRAVEIAAKVREIVRKDLSQKGLDLPPELES